MIVLVNKEFKNTNNRDNVNDGKTSDKNCF